MPRHRAGPRLYLKAAEAASASGGSRPPIWIIRDGSQRKSTGCHQHEREEAEQALADYIASKYRPPTGIGQSLLVEEALAAYLKDNENSPSFKSLMLPTAVPFAEWWKGKTLREVVKRNCVAYVSWRTSQFKKRHPNSKAKPEQGQRGNGSPRFDEHFKRPSTPIEPTMIPSWWCRKFRCLQLRQPAPTTG